MKFIKGLFPLITLSSLSNLNTQKYNKIKKYLILLITHFALMLTSQSNLVPNPSFELYSDCPSNLGQLNLASPWFLPSTGTSDFFHACASTLSILHVPGPLLFYDYCNPHSGNGIAGLCYSSNVTKDYLAPGGGYREYLAVRLTSQLINNTTYYVSFYAKLSDSSLYAGRLSLFFSKDSISKSQFDTITANPQIISSSTAFIKDKKIWTKVQGSFVSNGTERFVYIGNFKPSLAFDTMFVGPHDRNSDGAYLLRPNFAYYYIDDVCISADQDYCNIWTGIDKISDKHSIKTFSNPITDVLMIEALEECRVEIFDMNGNLVLDSKQNAGINQINTETLKAGLYTINAISVSGIWRGKLVKVN